MKTPLTFGEARQICLEFAKKHNVTFEEEGEVGFGRECVGFLRGHSWIDHNPRSSGNDYEPIKELACDAAWPPDDVNAYHKHDCLAVLGRGDEAVIGLARWVQEMESKGIVEIKRYDTGATGLQAVISGAFGNTVFITP